MTDNNQDFNPNISEGQAYKDGLNSAATLVLYNDNVNTFQYVIDCLAEACAFDEIQAEQLTLLTHYKGRAVIRQGSLNDLLDLNNKLQELGLSSEIIKNEAK
jgi:ATP-dependent Clp protease adaptor protein ClpS